jgi:hypothetical protein
VSRELRALGYRKLSARPRHHGQPEGAIGDLKKGFPVRLDEIARERGVEPSARFYRLRNRLDSWELDRLDRTQALWLSRHSRCGSDADCIEEAIHLPARPALGMVAGRYAGEGSTNAHPRGTAAAQHQGTNRHRAS